MRVQEISAEINVRRRKAHALGAVVGSFVCAAFAGAAAAQSNLGAGLGGIGGGLEGGVPGLAAGKRLGVELTARADYHTNVVGGSDVAATVKGLQQNDITYSPNASVTGAVPVGPGSVYVVGNIGYLFHQNNAVLNSPKSSIQFGVSGPVRLGPCALSLILGYTATPSDQSQLLLQTLKNVQSTEKYGISAQCSEGGAFGQFVGAQHQILNNSSKMGTANSDTTTVSTGVSYRNRVIGEFMISGVYATTNSAQPAGINAVAPLSTPSHGFESYTLGMTLSRPISSRMSGVASIGYTTNRSSGGAVTANSAGVTGSGTLNYRLSPRIGLMLSYQRAQQASIQIGSSYSTNDEVSLSANYATPSHLSASFSYHIYQRQEHITDPALAAAAGPLTFGASRERGSAESASFGFPLGRKGQISLNLARANRNTNLTVYNYTDYSAGLALTERF